MLKDFAFGLLGKYLSCSSSLKKQNLEIVSNAMWMGFMQEKWPRPTISRLKNTGKAWAYIKRLMIKHSFVCYKLE